MFKNLLHRRKEKWRKGIPKYKESDLMTEAELLEYAMNTYIDTELKNSGYKIISKNFNLSEMINYTCEKYDEKIYIFVKCAIAPDFPVITKEEKGHLLSISKEHGAICYFAPVGLASFDEKRMDASLALRGDHFRYRYRGLNLITDKVPDDWLKTTLDAIHDLGEIKYSLSYTGDSDASYCEKSYKNWEKTVNTVTFQEKLMSFISEKGMTNQQFYKAALLDRKLFSAINTNPNYQPKKETAVACCLGLKLDINETKDLLRLAGYSLSLSITWDKIVYYCIDNHIFDIDIINELLYAEGEKCIRL